MFYDAGNNPISSANLQIGSGKQLLLNLKVSATAGKKLICYVEDGAADVSVEAQFQGGGWFDLLAGGADLTPYDGDTPIFQLRITADDVVNLVIENLIFDVVEI